MCASQGWKNLVLEPIPMSAGGLASTAVLCCAKVLPVYVILWTLVSPYLISVTLTSYDFGKNYFFVMANPTTTSKVVITKERSVLSDYHLNVKHI